MQQISSSANIKRINLDAVYWYIYAHAQASAKDIVMGLGLSLPTVTQNLNTLMALGLVVSTGMMQSTGGRKARAYALNDRGRFTLGLDITSRRVGLAVVDLKGGIVGHDRLALPYRDEAGYYRAVANFALAALSQLGADPSDALGAGISLPAILSGDGECTVNATALGASNISRSAFAAHLPFPCALYNDANAGGYAEFWAMDPARTGARSLAYLSVSDTVGGSIMIQGKMYLGLAQHSAEFGHMTLVPGGDKCYCGQQGCAYAYINTRRLSEMAGGELDNFFQALKAGDPALWAAWDQYLDYLALAIGNIRAALDLDVIIGGYLGRYIGPYMGELRGRVAQRNMFEGTGDYVLAGAHVAEVAAMGAALMRQYEAVKQLIAL